MKPFLNNNGCLNNSKRLAKRFNEHYINIVERSVQIDNEKRDILISDPGDGLDDDLVDYRERIFHKFY